MGNTVDAEGYELEVLGSCTTNAREGSQHRQPVQASHLWSFAQEEALVALSEQGADRCWRLITDPERRAKRIAARHADLYFKSAEKSRGKLQLYWPALAAFVVKDIVEAFRYSRANVLEAGWGNLWRTGSLSSIGSLALSSASPYEHALRVYAALAKGNLWLFQDIYPWLWYVLEYGLKRDGTMDAAVLHADVGQRDTQTLQAQSRAAVQELPFNSNWLSRLNTRITADPVYTEASSYFRTQPVWGGTDGGYGQHQASAWQAHSYVKRNVASYDGGYRMPASGYWRRFNEAYYVMEEERKELLRVIADTGALGRLQNVAHFKVTAEVRNTYAILIAEHAQTSEQGRTKQQRLELREIAKQEQLNVLQPLIYDDVKLGQTMDLNHDISRRFPGISRRYQVIYSAAPTTNDPTLRTVFDPPSGAMDWVGGATKSLANSGDRMAYVADIAKKFDDLMTDRRAYMDGELQKIRAWINA